MIVSFVFLCLPLFGFSDNQPDSTAMEIIRRMNDSVAKINYMVYSSQVSYMETEAANSVEPGHLRIVLNKDTNRFNLVGTCWVAKATDDTLYGYKWRIREYGDEHHKGWGHFYDLKNIYSAEDSSNTAYTISPKAEDNYTLFMEELYNLHELIKGVPEDKIKKDSIEIAILEDSCTETHWAVKLKYSEVKSHAKVGIMEWINLRFFYTDILWINKKTYLPERLRQTILTVNVMNVIEKRISGLQYNQKDIKKALDWKISRKYQIRKWEEYQNKCKKY